MCTSIFVSALYACRHLEVNNGARERAEKDWVCKWLLIAFGRDDESSTNEHKKRQNKTHTKNTIKQAKRWINFTKKIELGYCPCIRVYIMCDYSVSGCSTTGWLVSHIGYRLANKHISALISRANNRIKYSWLVFPIK